MTLKNEVFGAACSSSSTSELLDERDSLPKWCSNHFDVSTLRVSSSWSKSRGRLVSASFLSRGEPPFSRPRNSHGLDAVTIICSDNNESSANFDQYTTIVKLDNAVNYTINLKHVVNVNCMVQFICNFVKNYDGRTIV